MRSLIHSVRRRFLLMGNSALLRGREREIDGGADVDVAATDGEARVQGGRAGRGNEKQLAHENFK